MDGFSGCKNARRIEPCINQASVIIGMLFQVNLYNNEGYPGQWHFQNHCPADERLVSRLGSGSGFWGRIAETPAFHPCGGVFVASVQTLSESDLMAGSLMPRVWRDSEKKGDRSEWPSRSSNRNVRTFSVRTTWKLASIAAAPIPQKQSITLGSGSNSEQFPGQRVT